MFVIVGWLVILVCVFGVYIFHGGNIMVILHALPFELITIGGATIGAFLANNQMKVVKATVKGLGDCFKGSKYTKARYMDLMALMFDILQKARKEGLMAIEKDVESPEESEIFKKYPAVGSDHHVVEFITDYLRMMVSGNLNAHEIESLMDNEIETHHHEAHAAVAAIQRVAGGLPAFGIVAAVLGVVNTMGSALVGTFLGILLAYAFAEPLAGVLEQKVEEAGKELQCIKTTLLASMQGYNPSTAIEFGRKVLFSTERPSFTELEEFVKKK
jgi:chemotaxis protein MotA